MKYAICTVLCPPPLTCRVCLFLQLLLFQTAFLEYSEVLVYNTVYF